MPIINIMKINNERGKVTCQSSNLISTSAAFCTANTITKIKSPKVTRIFHFISFTR